MKHDQSQRIFERARQLMPGGVNSPARAFGAVGGEPIVFARGEGAYLFDVDGNRYIDYIGSWGPMILGHGHPRVTEAVIEAARRGTSFGAPTEAENEMAQLIIDLVPSVEKVRLVNSGTEATMSAIRLARGFTGRDRIVKFAGNYHGHVDSLLVAAGSAAATLSVPNSPGVTKGTSQDTLVLRYNDVEALANAFEQQGSQIAGVIMEPVVGNMGCVIPTPEFLQALRDLTHHHGTLLICDEVMTGFRVAAGGRRPCLASHPTSRRWAKSSAEAYRSAPTADGPMSWTTCCRPEKCFKPARSAAIPSPPPPVLPHSASCRSTRPMSTLRRSGCAVGAGTSPSLS